MRKQQDFLLNNNEKKENNNDKHNLAPEKKNLKCLECNEILVLNWFNENTKILLCSNSNVIFLFN